MAAGKFALTIVPLVVTTVEATTPLAVSGQNLNTAFRVSRGPTLEAALSRQFEVIGDQQFRLGDTGVNEGGAGTVETVQDFTVRVRFLHGSQSSTDFALTCFEDCRRIRDRVIRAVRESGGGAMACWSPEPIRPRSSETPQSVHFDVPFRVHFTEDEYTTGG